MGGGPLNNLAAKAGLSNQRWRSLHYFNLYRLTVSGVFVASYVMFGPALTYGAADPTLFFAVSIAYALFSALLILPLGVHWPRFDIQLTVHVLGDVTFVVVLMYASGGLKSGLGLLLLVSLATSGLVGRGRLVRLHATFASIAVFLEHAYRVVVLGAETAGFFQAALLSAGFFAIAGLAHILARRLVATEAEAEAKSIDLENLAQVNQRIIQNLDDGVLVVDGGGRLRQHNAQAANLLGHSLLLRHEPMLRDYFPVLAARYRRWQAEESTENKALRAPVTGKPLRTNFMPVGVSRERGAVIFLQDVGRIQAQAQQFKLAALGRLTANIAHEIRNPLSAISYASELLLEDAGVTPSQSRLLQIIQDNTRRLDKMVQEVLRLNRRDRAAPEYIDLVRYVSAFVEEFALVERIDPKLFAVTVEDARGVCFDPSHLNQVLWNLCRNAWRHCRRQVGSIGVSITGLDDKEYVIQLVVRDDGPGVPEFARPQLFEPFFTTASQGTGLGLYVARELCDANGAMLDYVAGEESVGGQFRISFRGEPC